MDDAIEAARNILAAEWRAAGAALKVFPRGPIGLTPDGVKAAPEWRAARQRYDRAFAALRDFNSAHAPTRGRARKTKNPSGG